MRIFGQGFAMLTLAMSALAIKSIEVKGNAFYENGTDSRFYMKGLDYQPGGSSKAIDPLADKDICERDIKYFKKLGINTIRIYSIDNSKSHKECMSQLADAGIYVIADVNNAKASINNAQPKCSYNAKYLNEVFATVKEMSQYDNTLGVFAGNEVVSDKPSTVQAAPYAKAVVRDIKKYIKNNGLRKIPVGYSAADVASNRLQTALYFNCGDDEDARIDMFGYNDYSWCGDSSFEQSGWASKVKSYSNYTRPIFLSEFGCNKQRPRKFSSVKALFSDKMTGVYSGGLVYEYTEESNDYGLVKVSNDSSEVKTNEDFDYLSKAYNDTKPPSGDGGAHTDNSDANSCPGKSKDWNITSTDLPETPKAAQEYINGTATPKGLGLGASTMFSCSEDDNEEVPSDQRNSDSSSSRSGGGSSSSGGSSSGSGSLSSGSSSSSSGSSKSGKKKSGASGISASVLATFTAYMISLLL